MSWTARVPAPLAVAAGAAAFLFAAGFLIFAAMATRPAPPHAGIRGDAIVVLTGGEYRVQEAVRLLADGRAQRLLISGVNARTTPEQIRRTTGIDSRRLDCCIDLGYGAHDTVGNAEETRAWVQRWGFRRVVIVTSGYHMPRSLTELERVLPDTELIPYPVVSRNVQREAWWLYPGTIRLMVVEYLKLLPSIARLGAARIGLA